MEKKGGGGGNSGSRVATEEEEMGGTWCVTFMTAICRVKSAMGVVVLLDTAALILMAPSASRALETWKTMCRLELTRAISCVLWSGSDDEKVHSSSVTKALLRALEIGEARGGWASCGNGPLSRDARPGGGMVDC